MRLIPHLLPLALIAGLCQCSRNKEAQAVQPPAPAAPAPAPAPAIPMAVGTVAETFDAANYTYLRVKTDTGDIWAAATPFKVRVGDKVAVPTEMPMEKFHSATLKRTFPVIYFTSKVLMEGDPRFPAAR
jgi:hypothetical protein